MYLEKKVQKKEVAECFYINFYIFLKLKNKPKYYYQYQKK